MHIGRVWAFLATLVTSGFVSLVFAQAGHSGTATGNASVALEDRLLTVAFSAVTQPDGSAAGQIHLHDPAPLPDQDVDGTGDPALVGSTDGVTVQAAVNCLAVDGQFAIVGGEVTQSNVGRYVGKQVLLYVEDSGKLGRFSWGVYDTQDGVFCDSFPWAAYTPQGISGGGFQVQQ